jgi:hypothetical protein
MNIDTVSGRPLDIGEVLGDTFAVIGRTFVLLANVVLMFVAIPAVVRLAGVVLAPLSPAFTFLALFGGVASFVGALFAYAAIYQIVMQGLHGETSAPSLVLDKAARKFWLLIVLAVLLALVMSFGFLILIVPGVILAVASSAAFPALVLEDRGVVDAFRRSIALTRHKRWSIFVLYFIVSLVTLIVALVLFVLLGGFHGFVLGQPNVAVTVVTSVLVVVVVPFNAVMTTALYNRLRGNETHEAEAMTQVFA